MIFMGSTVVYGRGKAVVTATGMKTEMGKIADALSKAEEGKTPLQIKLAGLSKILTYLVIGICVVIFAVQLIRDGIDFAVAYQGILVTLITMASYLIGRYYLADLHHAEAISMGTYSAEMLGTSMAFLTLSLCEICHAFNMRSLHGSIFKMNNQNLWLWGAGALSLLLTTLVVEVDFLAKAFELAHLDLLEYTIAFILAVSIIPIVEIIKIFHRAWDKKKA